MQSEASDRKRRRLGRVAFWLGVGLLVTAVFRSISVTETDGSNSVGQSANESDLRTIRVKTVDRHPEDPNRPAVERDIFELTAGEVMSIAVRDLPTEGPLSLDLLVPAAPSNADALPARIFRVNGSGELKLPDAVVATDADRDRVRVEVERSRLSPGRYRIEIETTGRSKPAMRRYLLEIHPDP